MATKGGVLFLFIVFNQLLFAQDYKPRPSEGELVEHVYYSISYVESHEQAEWVYYELTYEMINGEAVRKDNFQEDPAVLTGSAQLTDYKGSGYDRGHLAPAADMKLNETSMSESFYMSNMSPQDPSFNRGKWKKLEEMVRSWVKEEQSLIIVTGPIFRGNHGVIGENEVTVPGFYYKVIYNPSDSSMVGFILPNEKIERSIESYACNVNHVEAISGIDFFYKLEDEIEEQMEGTLTKDVWFKK